MKYAAIVFNLLFIIREISSLSNPCPEYFDYYLNGNTKYCIITIPGPSKGKTVIMAYIAFKRPVSDHSGGLYLVKTLEDAVADGERGRDIQFRLDFPQSGQWPVITKITLNNRDICIGPSGYYQLKLGFGRTLFNPEGATELSYIPDISRPTPKPNPQPKLNIPRPNPPSRREISSQSSPCPDYFEYLLNGNTKYGIITIPGPSKGRSEIMAHIAILGGPIYDHNSGGLQLVKTLEDTVADGERGEDIQFRLSFPQSEQWPVITKITLNNRDICVGPGVHNVYQWSFGQTLINPKGATELSYIPDRLPKRSNLISRFVTPLKPNSTPRPNPPLKPNQPKSNPPSNSGLGDDPSWLKSLSHARMCDGDFFQTTDLIMGGKETERSEFPWMVALYHYTNKKPEYKCAGSLVSNEYVITAAHCLVGQKRIYLELGHHDLSDSDEEYIKPICLWSFGTKVDSFLTYGTITGWGRKENDGDFSDVPMKLIVKRVDQNTCKKSNPALERIVTGKTFCAGGQNAGPCHGDSGSGFYHYNNNIWYLRGIVSMALGNIFVCNVQEYAVYVDIAFFLDWLRPYLLSE